MLVLLMSLIGCTHVTAVAAGPRPGEFYAVVERNNPLKFIPIDAPQGHVLWCQTTGNRTACVTVYSAMDGTNFSSTAVAPPTQWAPTSSYVEPQTEKPVAPASPYATCDEWLAARARWVEKGWPANEFAPAPEGCSAE